MQELFLSFSFLLSLWIYFPFWNNEKTKKVIQPIKKNRNWTVHLDMLVHFVKVFVLLSICVMSMIHMNNTWIQNVWMKMKMYGDLLANVYLGQCQNVLKLYGKLQDSSASNYQTLFSFSIPTILTFYAISILLCMLIINRIIILCVKLKSHFMLFYAIYGVRKKKQ